MHARSRSISAPSRIRLSDASERLQTVNCLMATTLNAVGITQLPAPGHHGHPYLSGSNLTLRSAVLNFQRHNQWLSLPRDARSQFNARARASETSFKAVKVQRAKAVVQDPSGSPSNAGHPPSARCEFIRNRVARAVLASSA